MVTGGGGGEGREEDRDGFWTPINIITSTGAVLTWNSLCFSAHSSHTVCTYACESTDVLLRFHCLATGFFLSLSF